jgi:hypothetical protein
VNRRGDVYYLQQGKTRTGKPKYYTGKKLTGDPLDALPDGFEFYESPEDARVVIRKIKPSVITEFERKQAEEIVRRKSGLDHCIVAIDGDALVVYTPSVNRAETDRIIEELAGPFQGLLTSRIDEYREERIKHSMYTKMLRFELIDPDKRTYHVERWCFLGSIDDWISLHDSGSIADLAGKYAKHLDKESFYDLM